MKFLHLGDLHLGKRVNEFPMLKDQRYVLEQILQLAQGQGVDGFLIAGDVYDRTVPGPEAVELLDWFLTESRNLGLVCFLISGNHDSPERLAFGGRLLADTGVYLSPVFDGSLQPIPLEDEYGPVLVWLLPFLRPVHVRRYEQYSQLVEPGNYEQAVQAVLAQAQIDPSVRNVLLAHQFVTAGGEEPERCESETIAVGTLENVDASVFEDFDYVALGHIHGPQRVGRDTLRYSGSPLKYSFSEARHQKSVPLVELGAKGAVTVTLLPLTPLRDMRELRGQLSDLLRPEAYAGTNVEDYLHITLTDEAVLDAMEKVRTVYPNVMRLDFDNTFTARVAELNPEGAPARRASLELFEEFFTQQNNEPMADAMRARLNALLEDLKEDGQ